MADQNQNPLISPVAEEEQFFSPEGLMSATTSVDWDALLNRGISNSNNSSNLSKWERDSLYVKFDPLVASRNQSERLSGIFKAPKPPGPSKQFLSQQNGFSPRTSGNLNFNASSMSLDESYRTAYQDLSMSMPLVEEECVSPSSPLKNGIETLAAVPEAAEIETGTSTEKPIPIVIVEEVQETNTNATEEVEKQENKVIEEAEVVLSRPSSASSYTIGESKEAETASPIKTTEFGTTQNYENALVEDVEMDMDMDRDESLADLCIPHHIEEYCMSPNSPDGNGNSENGHLVFSLDCVDDDNGALRDKSTSNVKVEEAANANKHVEVVESKEVDENKGEPLLEKSNLMGELEEAFSHLSIEFGANTPKTNQSRGSISKEETNTSCLTEYDAKRNEETRPFEKNETIPFRDESFGGLCIPQKEQVAVIADENTSAQNNSIVAEAIDDENKSVADKSASIVAEDTQEAANKQLEGEEEDEKHVVDVDEVDDDNAEPLSEKSKLIYELKETVSQLTLELEAKVKENRELLAKEEMDLNKSVEEYMKAQKNYEKVQLEKDEMIMDRDEALADLRNMEKGFADMLMMYEGIKNCQNDIEKNCETLMKREAMLMTLLERREERNEACQQHFDDILGRLEQDFDSKIREREAENTKLRAKLRICDIKIGNTESEIAQIDRENEKLKSLCDDLLKK